MKAIEENKTDLLKRCSSRWTILMSMYMDMQKQGIQIPDVVSKNLKISRIEIKSGCFPASIINGSLSRAEGTLIANGWALGQDYLDKWLELLSSSTEGTLDYDGMITIPALKQVLTSLPN